MNSIRVADSDNGLVLVNDATKGVKYSCLHCGRELILANGDIRRKYFRHKDSKDNNKECIEYTGRLFLAKLFFDNTLENGFYRVNIGRKSFNKKFKNIYLKGAKVGIVTYANERILVEVVNTYKDIEYDDRYTTQMVINSKVKDKDVKLFYYKGKRVSEKFGRKCIDYSDYAKSYIE